MCCSTMYPSGVCIRHGVNCCRAWQATTAQASSCRMVWLGYEVWQGFALWPQTGSAAGAWRQLHGSAKALRNGSSRSSAIAIIYRKTELYYNCHWHVKRHHMQRKLTAPNQGPVHGGPAWQVKSSRAKRFSHVPQVEQGSLSSSLSQASRAPFLHSALFHVSLLSNGGKCLRQTQPKQDLPKHKLAPGPQYLSFEDYKVGFWWFCGKTLGLIVEPLAFL